MGGATSLRVLKYALSSSPGLFPKPELVGKKLLITLDEKPIDNLSSVTAFVGSSDQDLENVAIHLRFLPVDGQPPRLIQVGPKLTAEKYKEIKLPAVGDGSLRIGYEIKVWNRGTVIQFDSLFEGAKAPEVLVDTFTKGVVTKLVPFQAKNEGDWATVGMQSAIGVAIAATLLVILQAASEKWVISRRMRIEMNRINKMASPVDAEDEYFRKRLERRKRD